jgi:hypothetical protein
MSTVLLILEFILSTGVFITMFLSLKFGKDRHLNILLDQNEKLDIILEKVSKE